MQSLFPVFYLRLVVCCFHLFYLQRHRRVDIMRTWVPNEKKRGKTRLLSAAFSGRLLKKNSRRRSSLTGPLTWKQAFYGPALTEQTVQQDANVQLSVMSLWWDGLKRLHGSARMESGAGSRWNLASKRKRLTGLFLLLAARRREGNLISVVSSVSEGKHNHSASRGSFLLLIAFFFAKQLINFLYKSFICLLFVDHNQN